MQQKKIFTSYFLSCVQLHTFRRLSLGEWPQRESASLLLNSKGKKIFYETCEPKETSRTPLQQAKGNAIMHLCSTSLYIFPKTMQRFKAPRAFFLILLFTITPSELLWDYLGE